MISYVFGTLKQKTPTYIVVETGGIGFQLFIPLSSYSKFGDVGEDLRVLTYLHVREDVLQLYGFATEEERELFQMLISVSGIGPRSAQGILSGISVEEFKTALIHSDLHTLTSAPGVGKKTAERLVVELREKIAKTGKGEAGMPPIPVSENCEEAVLALITLGYKRPKAEQIVQRELQENDSLSVEEILRRALRRV